MFTANCGVVEVVLGMQVEILSHNFHNPTHDIVCYYIKEGNGIITEVTYYESLDKKNIGSGVYKFKNGDLGHYWSRNYKMNELPEKYKTIVYKLRECHRAINFNAYDKNRVKRV